MPLRGIKGVNELAVDAHVGDFPAGLSPDDAARACQPVEPVDVLYAWVYAGMAAALRRLDRYPSLRVARARCARCGRCRAPSRHAGAAEDEVPDFEREHERSLDFWRWEEEMPIELWMRAAENCCVAECF